MKLEFRFWPIFITSQFKKYPRKKGFVKIKFSQDYYIYHENAVYMSSTVGPQYLVEEFFAFYELTKL